jgi:hypothetical protein
MTTLEADFQKYSEAESLAAVSYTTGTIPFHFGQLNVKVGATTGAAASVSGVTGVSCKIERGQDTTASTPVRWAEG